MSLIDEYANQSLTWEHVASRNKYNEPTYTTATIRGRKETGNRMVRDAQGQEVISSALVITASAVAVNDRIDGRVVIAVDAIADLDGATDHYEAYLK